MADLFELTKASKSYQSVKAPKQSRWQHGGFNSYSSVIHTFDVNSWIEKEKEPSVSEYIFLRKRETATSAQVGSPEGLYDALIELGSLTDDWDEEGALKPEAGNIENLRVFLIQANDKMEQQGKRLSMPELNACADGAVDVVWRMKDAFLLINFRSPEEGVAYYYFDRYNDKLGRQGGIALDQNIPGDVELYLKAVAK